MYAPTMLLRRRDVARILALTEAQVRHLEMTGVLHPVHIPGVRTARFTVVEVERLAGRAPEPAGDGAPNQAEE